MQDLIQNSLGQFPFLTVNKIVCLSDFHRSTHEQAGIEFSIAQSHHAIWNPNFLCQEMLSTMYTQRTYVGDANDMSTATQKFFKNFLGLSFFSPLPYLS